MRLLIAADDIQPNDFVSVYSPTRDSIPELSEHAELAALVQKKTAVPAGVPLRVLERSLPFVVCAVIEPGGNEAGPIILDLREVNLCRLDTRFIKAIVSFQPSDTADEEESDDDGVLL